MEINTVDLRDFTHDNHKTVDDKPYGGGAGMLMKPEPLFEAVESLKSSKAKVLLTSPSGEPFTQKMAHELMEKDDIVIICGHYEGMDERIYSRVDEQISIGDYVLTGGEIAAMAVSDAVIRLLPGAIRDGSTSEESFENGLLEYPQYTQPAVYEGEAVPEVLLSGHHEKIRKWRLRESLRKTLLMRPDLLDGREMTEEEAEILEELAKERK